MLGAIIGDIIGSRHEFIRTRTKDFELFTDECSYTDDTILTIAIADAVMNDRCFSTAITDWTKRYPNPMGGYGAMFSQWIELPSYEKKPYNSFGNGSAMRVGAIPYLCDEEYTSKLAKESSEITHDHPQGIRGALVTANAAKLLLRYREMDIPLDIREFNDFILTESERFYNTDRSYFIEWNEHVYNETCQGCVPPSIISFLYSTDFEHAIRNAVALGGDADTLACITGQLAQAYYGLDLFSKKYNIIDIIYKYLPQDMIDIILQFEEVTNEKVISNSNRC